MDERIVTRAIVLDDQRERVLLGKRAEGTSGGGKWAMFGGKPNPEETLREALIREVFEETGLDFVITDYWRTWFDGSSIPSQRWEVTAFIGHASGDIKLDPRETCEAGWFTRQEITKLDMAFDHQERLLEFFAEKTKS